VTNIPGINITTGAAGEGQPTPQVTTQTGQLQAEQHLDDVFDPNALAAAPNAVVTDAGLAQEPRSHAERLAEMNGLIMSIVSFVEAESDNDAAANIKSAISLKRKIEKKWIAVVAERSRAERSIADLTDSQRKDRTLELDSPLFKPDAIDAEGNPTPEARAAVEQWLDAKGVYWDKVQFVEDLKQAIGLELARARKTFDDAGEEADAAIVPGYRPKEINYDIYENLIEVLDAVVTETDGRTADAAFQAAEFSGSWSEISRRRWDPLALDLDGDGQISTIDTPGGVFDIRSRTENRTRTWSGGGLNEAVDERTVTTRFTEWFAPSEGIIVMDRNNDGNIQAEDLFGDESVTGRAVQTGYEDLALLDENGDGHVNTEDSQFLNLQIWQDANSDGIAQAGELKSLYKEGVTDLNTEAMGGAVQGEDASVIQEGSLFTKVDGLILAKDKLGEYMLGLQGELAGIENNQELNDLLTQLKGQMDTARTAAEEFAFVTVGQVNDYVGEIDKVLSELRADLDKVDGLLNKLNDLNRDNMTITIGPADSNGGTWTSNDQGIWDLLYNEYSSPDQDGQAQHNNG